MKYTFTILIFILIGQNAQSQIDSLQVSKLIIGTWKYDYSIHYNSKTEITDTLYVNEVNRTMYLEVTPTTSEEISINNEEPDKKLPISEGKGEWKIYLNENPSTIHVIFYCGGIILCGDYEVVSINSHQLILKDFVVFEDGRFHENTICLMK